MFDNNFNKLLYNVKLSLFTKYIKDTYPKSFAKTKVAFRKLEIFKKLTAHPPKPNILAWADNQ